MLIVIALGGNALLQRGEPLEAEKQKMNVKLTAKAIAELAKEHDVVVCHGNGPQVGLLALQNEAYTKVKPYPLDVLDAETQGMIGYLIQNEVGNASEKNAVTLLTQILVDQHDPAFNDPSKPIGPVYTKEQAEEVAKERGWNIAPDGKYFRRVVPSPQPMEVVELDIISTLIKAGNIVVCGGGGGIPVIRDQEGRFHGVEAVIDKDNTSALIAEKLGADMLIILTDVTAACVNFGTPEEKKIKAVTPDELINMEFARGSMKPKVTACCRFVKNSGKKAAIGRLSEVLDIVVGIAGTHVRVDAGEISYY